MPEKVFDSLTDVEKADYYKLMTKVATVDTVKTPTTVPITEPEKGSGLTRPTQIVYVNEKEGVKITETIEYMHPPDHPAWGAEKGRKYIVEKIAVK